ncbi:MAG TPA: hypothetical protein VD860_00840 [Azospirillum sp.]|nr:hypothetical protein [Azospirillum sp.]
MPTTDQRAAAQREEFGRLLARLSDDQLRAFLAHAKALTAVPSPTAER